MNKLIRSAVAAAAVVLLGAGCSNSPGNPSVSFTSPVASGPSNGTSYKFKEQPVSVAITNAVRTSPATATYSLEVASDSSFTTKVFTRDAIAEGNGGTTSVTLSQLSATNGNVTYYWRSIATVDGVASPPSATQSFVIQQQIIINTPTLSEPASGSTTSEVRPTFIAKNASRQGAVGTITYVFQVSKASDFSSTVASATVTEQSGGQTSWTPTGDLPDGTLYWRVQARDDSNTETSAFTSPSSFIVEPFDPHKALFYFGPPDIASWAETTKITSVDFSTGFMMVDFDRREGSDQWPEAASASFGPLQYTLGMCFKFGSQWHCSAPVQFWAGRELEASGPWDQIGDNWFYDARWGPMNGHQPAVGERVVIWLGQGNLRGANGATYRERSNFLVIPFGINYVRR